MKVTDRDVEKIAAQASQKARKSVHLAAVFALVVQSSELDLRGQRYEEALLT